MPLVTEIIIKEISDGNFRNLISFLSDQGLGLQLGVVGGQRVGWPTKGAEPLFL